MSKELVKPLNEVDKPWGKYVDYFRSDEVVFKKLFVLPDKRLSYQYHSQRDEFWYVTEGVGLLIKDGLSRKLLPRDYILIESYENHTIECISDEPLVIYEMQVGSPSEDDIVRIEDKYGRKDETS